VAFDYAGVYTIELQAFDGSVMVSDTVEITVSDTTFTNDPPGANAGPDATVRFLEPFTLQGIAGDDGYPQGNSLSVYWEVLEAAGTAAIQDVSNLQSDVTFS